MKQLLGIFCIGSMLAIFSSMTQAAVVQSAKDALSNDIFVSGRNRTNKSVKAKHNRSNIKVKKANEENSSSQIKKETPKKDTPQKTDLPSQKESSDVQDKPQNPNAGYGYTKKYASKLFKTYSGHITIEQKNIPSRLGVTKGSTIQFNLLETPDTIWHIEIDKKIGKISSNKADGGQRILVIQAIDTGTTPLFLDNISIKDNKYRVIFSKKMSLVVDE